MTKSGLQDEEKLENRTGLAHFAVSLGSKEAVDAMAKRLELAGYPCLNGPRTTGDGYYEAVIQGFENNRIELTV